MSEESEPKIIVDEDWKAQVEKEKEALQQTESEPAGEAAGNEMPIPEASFEVLLATLASQAMAMMGLFPGPSGVPETNFPLSKHFIDIIAVIQEKTAGNLTDEESTLITDNLHQLRMAYVELSKQATGNPAGPTGVNEPPAPTIELP